MKISDEFSALAMSRQQKYQLRKRRDRRCIICGGESAGKWRCVDHAQEPKPSRAVLEAYRAVNAALSSGKIRRQQCERCDAVGEAHHDDYSKPLEIRWLCHKHHTEEHGRRCLTDKKIKILDLPEYHRLYRKEKVLTTPDNGNKTSTIGAGVEIGLRDNE